MNKVHVRSLLGLLLAAVCRPSLAGPPEVAKPPALAEFSDEIVTGGPSEFMTVRHLKMRGSNQAIGAKLAEIARDRHGFKPPHRSAEAMKPRWEYFRNAWPNQYERALGASAALGKAPDENFDTLSLTVDLKIDPACSVVYYPPKSTEPGHGMLSRNYDFTTGPYSEMVGIPAPAGASAMYANTYVFEVYPDKGYPALYLTANELLCCCIDGVNSEGLTVALLANADTEGGVPMKPTGSCIAGLDEADIGRMILDRCATIEDARKLLSEIKFYYTWIPVHFIIGDRSGQSFVWEYSMDCKKRYVVDGGGEVQVITNHPLHRMNASKKWQLNGGIGESQDRYDRLVTEIDSAGPKLSLDKIKYVNSCVAVTSKAPPPRDPHRQERTLWHSVYDCSDRSLMVDFYLGEGKDSAYKNQKRSGYLKFALQTTASLAEGKGSDTRKHTRSPAER
ncbi:MAG TPA: C45 family peptidase [Phycisphaerae bacterium]|nr:C45 family peptidase [Phycisphaerae bacterium]